MRNTLLRPEPAVKRREFGVALAAVLVGLRSGVANAFDGKPTDKEPKHICKGFNECKGQGFCQHGCSGHGCAGKNDCKGKGGCASKAAQHSCKGKNECKAMGGCASGDKGCASLNTCKTKGGCEVPLNYEHARPKKKVGA